MSSEAPETSTGPKGPEPGIPKDPDYFSNGGEKPYITSSELWWYTFFGLNHFAVNEPLWGLAKLMTAGGIGLWWLWDLIFVTANTASVKRNGFPVPFHFSQRLFGQGAISAGEPSHRQKTSYGLWALSTFLAPFGLQALFEDKYPLFIRNVFMLLIIFVTGSIIVPWFVVDGIGSIGFFGWIAVIFFAPILIWNLAITLVSWWSTVKVAFNKEALLKGGIHMTPETEGFLNGFRKDVNYLFGVVDPKMADIINNGWSAGGRQSSYYRDLFEPKTTSEIEATLPPPIDPKNPPPGTETIMFWALASPIVGIWIEVIKPIIYYLVPGAQVAYKAQDTALAALNTANNGMEAAQGAANAVSSVASIDPLAALKGFNPADAVKSLKFPGVGSLVGDGQKNIGNPADLVSIASGLGGNIPGVDSLNNVTAASSPAQLAVQAAQKRAAALNQGGGARNDELSNESLVLGGAVAAIVGAGALKMAIDYMIPI